MTLVEAYSAGVAAATYFWLNVLRVLAVHRALVLSVTWLAWAWLGVPWTTGASHL